MIYSSFKRSIEEPARVATDGVIASKISYWSHDVVVSEDGGGRIVILAIDLFKGIIATSTNPASCGCVLHGVHLRLTFEAPKIVVNQHPHKQGSLALDVTTLQGKASPRMGMNPTNRTSEVRRIVG